MERNALYLFLESRGISINTFYCKGIMRDRNNRISIPITNLGLILRNPTVHISSDNFARLQMVYDLTPEEYEALGKMVSGGKYRKKKSSKNKTLPNDFFEMKKIEKNA